jgi:hypothetical protein
MNSTRSQSWLVLEARIKPPPLYSTPRRLSIYSIYLFQLILIRLIAEVEFLRVFYFVDETCGFRFVQMNSDVNDEYFSYSYFHSYVNMQPYRYLLLGQIFIEGPTDLIGS